MEQIILNLLEKSPGLKAKIISKKLKIDKTELNAFLYKSDMFFRDDDFCWHIASDLKQKILTLGRNHWVDAESFEESLKKCGCLLDAVEVDVLVILPEGCAVMLDAGARLLSLLNQLVMINKNVTIDFNACPKTKSYFNRAGFFDMLHQNVHVLPKRPKCSLAKVFKGNNSGLVEYGLIDPEYLDEDIPKQLTKSFVTHSNEEYYISAFTIFSELFGNVDEHSNTPIPGFAALQKYDKKQKHIQTVVSDSGDGIAATLKPALEKYYPHIYFDFDFDDIHSDIKLVVKAFSEGGLSQFGSDPDEGARGLGLNKSTKHANRYHAKLKIRQERFSLELVFKNDNLLRVIEDINLPRILGTHICFDFFVD